MQEMDDIITVTHHHPAGKEKGESVLFMKAEWRLAFVRYFLFALTPTPQWPRGLFVFFSNDVFPSQTTFLLGRAIAAMSFPDMYRLQDFHSSKAPPLASSEPNHFTFTVSGGAQFGLEDEEMDPFASLIAASGSRASRAASMAADGRQGQSRAEDGGGGGGGGEGGGEEGGEEGAAAAEPFDYEDPRYLVVVANDERVVLEGVGDANADGWTALHACCHSPQTASAGLAVVEAMRRSGRGFEQRTLRGPGTGNKGWTALHMACAYGVEPLVVALCAAGYAKCQRLRLNLSSSVLP